jgi:hypothetical protein
MGTVDQKSKKPLTLQAGAFIRFKEAERRGDTAAMAAIEAAALKPSLKPSRFDPVAEAVSEANNYDPKDFEGANPSPYPGELVERIVRLRDARPELEDADVARVVRAHMRDELKRQAVEIQKDQTLSAEERETYLRWNRESEDWYAEAPERSRFAVIEAEDFAGAERAEPEWLVSEVLPRRGLAMIWGESGAGKSFFALDLAAAISRGVAWRDRPVTKGRAVIVVAEGEHSFGLRLKAYAQKHQVPLAQMPAVIPAAPNLSLKSDVQELVAALKESGAQFVGIDTLSMCSTGVDENSAQAMGQVVSLAKAIYRELDACVCLIHHAGKDTTRGARGSSVLRPAMDTEIFVEGDGESGVAKVEKLKDAARGARFPFKLPFVQLGTSSKTGKPFGSLCIEHAEDSFKGSPLNPNAAAILAKTREVLKGRESIPLVELTEDCKGVVTASCRNFTRTFKRAIAELTDRGHIELKDDQVSLRVVELDAGEFE